MDHEQLSFDGHRIPLADLAEATGVPAAAICRYIDLNLLPAHTSPRGQQLIGAERAQTVVVLRILELLDQDPQHIRPIMERRAKNAIEVDRALRDQVRKHAPHPELSPLLRQLPDS
ncbi:hypothetical protein AB0333_16525 [Citricoccus sp. NPDC079358]|uniref:hypothetical protein n=1 Tax=Citricoccus sp. NPDC079358 TaxID=3154653 RepID=UPI00344BF8C1